MNSIFDILKRKKKEGIKAVQDSDLVEYLTSLGVLGDIENGRCKCKFCGNVITIDNLEIIIPDDDKVSFVCLNTKCINQINKV